MHGQEEQPGGCLTDIVNIEILRHRRGHGELPTTTTVLNTAGQITHCAFFTGKAWGGEGKISLS